MARLPCHSVDNDVPADCQDCDVSACVVIGWTTSRSVCRTRRTCSVVASVPAGAPATTTTTTPTVADDGGQSATTQTSRRDFLDVAIDRR